jgi:hypothetical protein
VRRDEQQDGGGEDFVEPAVLRRVPAEADERGASSVTMKKKTLVCPDVKARAPSRKRVKHEIRLGVKSFSL